MRRFAQISFGLVALVVVIVVVLMIFRLPVVESLTLLMQGAFGGKFGFSRTLAITGPILLTGLAVVVAWRAGLYNIGGEGQMLVGGMFAAAVYAFVPITPGFYLQISMVCAAIIGGALYAGLASWLWVRRGVPLVISTILLNFIALHLLGWAVTGPLQEPNHQLPQTASLPDSVMFFRPDRQTDFHFGILLSLIACIAISVWLFRTYEGFRVRVIGSSVGVARASGWNVARSQHIAMLISGGLCGLAASLNYQGITGTVDAGFSQNWGFLGIPVALVGMLNPLGTAASALVFGALFAGSDQLSRFTPSGSAIVYVVQGVAVILFVVARSLSERRQVIGGIE